MRLCAVDIGCLGSGVVGSVIRIIGGVTSGQGLLKGGLTVTTLNVISYQRDPQKALPYSKPRRCSYRAWKSV